MTFHQFKDQNYIPSLKGHPSVSRRAAYQLIHWCSSWWEPPLISQSWEFWQFWSAVEVLPSKIKSWKTEVKRNWIFTRNDINFLSLSQISEATTCVNLLAFGWIYNTSMTLTISASDKYINTWTICFIRRLFWPSQRLLVRFWNWPWRFRAEGGKKPLKWDE